MSVETVTDMSAFEEALGVEGSRLLHRYPGWMPYRRSGNPTEPQIGDIAVCGHVKDLPQSFPGWHDWPRCQRCEKSPS